jgi:hypothetical protein
MNDEGTFWDYARNLDNFTRTSPAPKGAKCKECGSSKDLVPINTSGDYVCGKCWDKHGYEYDPTPW